MQDEGVAYMTANWYMLDHTAKATHAVVTHGGADYQQLQVVQFQAMQQAEQCQQYMHDQTMEFAHYMNHFPPPEAHKYWYDILMGFKTELLIGYTFTLIFILLFMLIVVCTAHQAHTNNRYQYIAETDRLQGYNDRDAGGS